ncbi:MAG TPA: metallophosphoesterase family protein [Baekduia sp.]|uniref:metallophosphoesterase family protein n=1 Tax=Baekduia sp. TaxID=2600305 RepID=UPI002D78624F|nr:metallophosphoesterase family protein [Baekduia sp.]HET6506814.1 metallophosphoesterase family protein [Baekduia sp.]
MLAILYDIHGNRPALEAVLEDARSLGADRWLLGGDYSAFGAWPVECVEILRALEEEATWIRGNWERWQVEEDALPDAEVIRGAWVAVREALGDGLVDELFRLPVSATLGDTLFVHGSPGSDVESFTPEASEDDDQLLAGVTAPRVIFGHTHLQFARRAASGIELVNPGSVGLPWDGDPRAAYATLSDDGETLDLHRVEYDVEAAATAVTALGGAWAEATARRLRDARF